MPCRFIEIHTLWNGSEFAVFSIQDFRHKTFEWKEWAMATKRKSGILALVVTLATTLVMASTAMTATTEPTAPKPKIEATAPLNTPDTKEAKAAPESDQKASDKKKGQLTGMFLTFLAVIAGHQGATH
jgi:hypothetical protein